jgi:hypothetical protein
MQMLQEDQHGLKLKVNQRKDKHSKLYLSHQLIETKSSIERTLDLREK